MPWSHTTADDLALPFFGSVFGLFSYYYLAQKNWFLFIFVLFFFCSFSFFFEFWIGFLFCDIF